jgi:hypothetical protein
MTGFTVKAWVCFYRGKTRLGFTATSALLTGIS